VSPDGSRYAYSESTGTLDPSGRFFPLKVHVVDIASGGDNVAYAEGHYQVLGWTAEGILLYPLVQGGPEPGLWALNPDTKVSRQLYPDHFGWQVGGGAAWAGEVDKTDPKAPEGPGAANRIVRLEPGSAKLTTWYTLPGNTVWISGFDQAGHPIVAGTNQGTPQVGHLILTSGPNSGREIWTGTPNPAEGSFAINNGTGDSHGIWFVGPLTPVGQDLLLYTNDQLRKIEGVKLGRVTGGCA
jgi:hypothetical protein